MPETCAGLEREKISRHSPTVVVNNDRQPGFCWLAIWAHEQNVQWRMVGLPNGIRPVGFAAVNQFKSVAVNLTSMMSKSDEIRWQGRDNPINRPVARRFLTQVFS